MLWIRHLWLFGLEVDGPESNRKDTNGQQNRINEDDAHYQSKIENEVHVRQAIPTGCAHLLLHPLNIKDAYENSNQKMPRDDTEPTTIASATKCNGDET
ncbi:hypothetical protein B1R32_1403 [Abditibacterium utsteinense]|uniref:Uncharacterized protein n=1 Tax=Abditibacterium utsteinense TaxID=1960156 RepID=A0A2S8SNN5_9BACT|nr:hypothetical protein B1R32_1403 [Abditibacterium utsteinense]